MKHSIDEFVMIYKDTPTFNDGALGKIIDRDQHDKSYLIAPLESVLKCEGDTTRLLEHGKWVKDENFEVLKFKRTRSITQFLYPFLLGSFLSLSIIGLIKFYG